MSGQGSMLNDSELAKDDVFIKAFKALERSKKMSDALNRAAAIFLSNSSETFDDMMSEGMSLIADIANLDRLSVWRNSNAADGLHSSQIYRWDKDSDGTTEPTAVLANLAYSKFAPRWAEILPNGESINSPVNLLPEAQVLKSFGVISAFITPILLKGDFWGFVFFEDRTNERYFDDDCAEMLRSAAFLCANAVIQAELEQKISKTYKFNKALLKSAPIGITTFDENINIIDCNDEMLRICGAPSKQHFIENFFNYSLWYQPNGQRSVDRAFEIMKRAQAGETVTVEWHHRTGDGKKVPCELTVTCVEHDGKFTGQAFVYDLRRMKKLEEEIREQSEGLKALNHVSSALLEPDSNFDNALQKALNIMGQAMNIDRICIWKNHLKETGLHCVLVHEWFSERRPAVIEAYITDASYDDAIPGWQEPLSNGEYICALVSDMPAEKQIQFKSQHIKSVFAVPVFVNNTFWGFIGYDGCAEERIFSENEIIILRSAGRLISNAIVRNDINMQFEIAKELAEQGSRSKSAFLSTMSHEIRTPMNAIIGMTVIGKAAADLPRKDYCFGKIESASQHLLGVINDVLDMSKIEANKFELSDVEYNIEKMLQRIVNIIVFRADEKRQKLTVHIDKAVPRTLIGDDQRLAQVITNLLSNAVKFTPEEGAVRLDAEFVSEEDGVCTIRIAVTDTGIGISETEQKHLFKSFQQADSRTSRKFGGTGLGLAISKSIIELMGGEIKLQSEAGKGSTFSFTFKMKRGKKRSRLLAGINWDNVSVMAVDDDQEILDYFNGVMESFGKSCDTALSGQEALALVGTNGMYDIYFVDWKMPDMDGIALARELKAKSESPENTIVIMISAAEWSHIADEAKKAGVDKFLSKPLFPSAIADAINEVIGLNSFPVEETADNTAIFKGYKVLLAEDVEVNREIVQALIIEPTQLEMDCAENGLQAVNMFEAAPDEYDLILMDVQMPEMDGHEATRRIRASAHPRGKTIPIIAMTANVFREDVEKCLKAGMDDHIGKPIDVDELLAMLKNYLPIEI
ncbi:MAG: response regulator [Chitinispirillia bacterium]|nr:response regulator [Chitinispirillia bacterium]